MRILLFRHSVKILANTLKVFCYIFHFIFPNKRFHIPSRGGPIIRPKVLTSIPRVLWQTNFTNKVTLPVYLNYLFNRFISPTYEYRFFTTDDRSAFIKAKFSNHIFNAYASLQIGAAQADLWRLLVLQDCGGVYMDIDAHSVWPLEFILKPGDEELFLVTKNREISNYFIATKPGNKNFELLIQQVLMNIRTKSSSNIYELTGPGVFNRVLTQENVSTRSYVYTCNQGNFTNEYFQYIDKPQGKWTKEQSHSALVVSEETLKK